MKIHENELPLFPLHTVLFPQTRLHLHISERRYLGMIQGCLEEDLPFGVVRLRDGLEAVGRTPLNAIGTIARIIYVARLSEGRMYITVTGVTRFRVLEHFDNRSYSTARIQLLPDLQVDLDESECAARCVVQRYREYIAAFPAIEEINKEPKKELQLPQDPTLLSYSIAARLPISLSDKQALLETPTTVQRLHREMDFLARELQLLPLVLERCVQIRDQGSFSLN